MTRMEASYVGWSTKFALQFRRNQRVIFCFFLSCRSLFFVNLLASSSGLSIVNKVKCDESLSALSSPRFALDAVLIFKLLLSNSILSSISLLFNYSIYFIRYKLMTFDIVDI